MTEVVHMTCFSGVAVDVRKLSTTTQSLERTDPEPVRKGEMRNPNGHETFGTSTRDLSVFCSGLYRRCLSARAMAAPTTRKTVLFDFGLSFPRTVEAWYRSLSVLSIISWTKYVIDGDATAPSVSTMPTTQSTNLMKEMASRKSSSASFSQRSRKLRHAKKKIHILLGGVHVVRES